MSILSQKNSSKKTGLDILEHQDVHNAGESEHKVHLNKIHDFNEIKIKPTELDPSLAEPKKQPQVSPYVSVSDFVKEEEGGTDVEFKTRMRNVLKYLRSVGTNKKIKFLEFDLSGYEKESDYGDVLVVLSDNVKKGVITKQNEKDIAGILKGVHVEGALTASSHIVESEEISVTEEALPIEDAREEYASQYAAWEQKVRNSKKMFAKALSDLGSAKPVPQRLVEKTPELIAAFTDYIGSIHKELEKYHGEEQRIHFLIQEREILADKINGKRGEKEKALLDKAAVSVWNKPTFTQMQRVMLSNALLSDGSFIIGTSESHAVGFEGFRAPRAIPVEPEALKVETRIVNEEALEAREKKHADSLEQEGDSKKRQILQKATKINGLIPPSPEIPVSESSVVKRGFFGSFKKALGFDALSAKTPIKDVSIVSEQELPLENKNTIEISPEVVIRVVPTNTEVERLQPLADPTPVPTTNFIYKDDMMDIVDTGVAKTLVMNSMEIAHETLIGDFKVLCLEDKFQDGEQYRPIREAYAYVQGKLAFDHNMAEQRDILDFEGGRIEVLLGFGGVPDGIKVFLNGKEIASGFFVKGKAKVALLDSPGFKSGWLLSDTVYERAFKTAMAHIKNIRFSK